MSGLDLIAASGRGDLLESKRLIEQCHVSLKEMDAMGQTPLHVWTAVFARAHVPARCCSQLTNSFMPTACSLSWSPGSCEVPFGTRS